jgi:hypothetical protein
MHSYIKGGMQAKDIWKQDIEAKIWAEEDANGDWRMIYNELYSLYFSPNVVRVIKSRRLRWVGHLARMEEGGRSAFRILTGTPAGKRPLGRPIRKREDNIRIDL